MTKVGAPTKVKWNEMARVGRPPVDLRTVSIGPNAVPRTFLCRGEWSIFTSCMHDDGSGFAEESNDVVQA